MRILSGALLGWCLAVTLTLLCSGCVQIPGMPSMLPMTYRSMAPSTSPDIHAFAAMSEDELAVYSTTIEARARQQISAMPIAAQAEATRVLNGQMSSIPMLPLIEGANRDPDLCRAEVSHTSDMNAIQFGAMGAGFKRDALGELGLRALLESDAVASLASPAITGVITSKLEPPPKVQIYGATAASRDRDFHALNVHLKPTLFFERPVNGLDRAAVQSLARKVGWHRIYGGRSDSVQAYACILGSAAFRSAIFVYDSAGHVIAAFRVLQGGLAHIEEYRAQARQQVGSVGTDQNTELARQTRWPDGSFLAADLQFTVYGWAVDGGDISRRTSEAR